MRTYNPLNVEELGRNAARALMSYPSTTLPPADSFEGAGVYTLHYRGYFPAYVDMNNREPIHVGKADLPGKRQGRAATGRSASVLYRRLAEHASSIESADNLELDDFSCRWLVLDSVWIGLTEQVLIAEYRPIWNNQVDGFGHHDQGRTRRNQRRSRWDTLHPGRPWAIHNQARDESVDDILAAIAHHREGHSA